MVVFKKSASRLLLRSSSNLLAFKDSGKELDDSQEKFSRRLSGGGTSVPTPLNSIPEAEEDQDEHGVPDDLLPWVSTSFLHEKVGIIVSDMSGFTRLTREYGVIHFASVIIRMRQVCFPILHHFGAVYITTEADDFIAVFRSAAAAVKAAHSMQTTVSKYNQTLPPHRQHFALTLNGVGVDFGRGPLVDKGDKLHGKTFSTAYLLGEELCQKGRVLVSGNVRIELARNENFADATFVEVDLGDDETKLEVGNLYDFSMTRDAGFSIPGVDDNRYLAQDLMCLAQRHSQALSSQELSVMDMKLRGRYMSKSAVLMFEFDDLFTREGAEMQMRLEFECLETIKSAFENGKANKVEDVLYLFHDAVDAVLVALQIRELINESLQSARRTGVQHAEIKGYGIHVGEVFTIPGTDVHWGDPINTASKLGQDLASGSDIIVSDTVYDTVASDSRMNDVDFLPTELSKSSVTFVCYKVRRHAPTFNSIAPAFDPIRPTASPNASSSNLSGSWWNALMPKCSCTGGCCDSDSEQVYQPQELRHVSGITSHNGHWPIKMD